MIGITRVGEEIPAKKESVVLLLTFREEKPTEFLWIEIECYNHSPEYLNQLHKELLLFDKANTLSPKEYKLLMTAINDHFKEN